MIVSLLFLAVVVTVVVIVVRKASGRDGSTPSDGHTVRRGFQYLLLYGLLVAVAVGVAGLLGRLFETDLFVAGDEAALARELAFVVVGGPLLAGMVFWTRRRSAADDRETRSLGWAAYVTVAALTALAVAAGGLHQTLSWVVGLEDYDGRALAEVLVWGAAWAVHWWLGARTLPPASARLHHLAGALIGLVLVATGLGGLLAGALRTLLGLEGDAVLAGDDNPMLRGLVTLAVGAPVWFVYWLRTASKDEREPLWLGYVLLAGVGGGLVTAIVSASMLLYSVLVWLVGDPGTTSAVEHFRDAPISAGAALVGVLVWWYHQQVLKGSGAGGRGEVRRIYEYLMAGTGLLAASVGLTMVLAAFVEAAAGAAFVGGDAVNTLLAALTLLVVGGPVWWVYWRRTQALTRRAPDEEIGSPTRRTYLFVLFGVGGVAAVVALVVGVYLLFQDAVEGTLSAETLRSMRFAVGVLFTTAAVAAYHWVVYAADRGHAPEAAKAHGPTYVLLVGPADAEIAREVARRTRGRVQAWARTDNGVAAWSVDEVMAALGDAPGDEVVVLAEGGDLRAIPVHRG